MIENSTFFAKSTSIKERLKKLVAKNPNCEIAKNLIEDYNEIANFAQEAYARGYKNGTRWKKKDLSIATLP